MTTSALKLPALIFLDCQTSSGSTTSGEIIELAWSIVASDGGLVIERSHLIQPTLPVSARVTQLTGITIEALQAAPPLADVITLLLADLGNGDTPFVIAHFASFEKRFLESACASIAKDISTWQWLCTHRLSKLLFPDIPSHTLRALTGYFSCPTQELKRAEPHVLATKLLWQELVRELERKGHTGWQDIHSLQQQQLKRQRVKHRELVDRSLRLKLPRTPGIYCFYGAGERLLYVGKATNLKDRVNSYFRGYTNKRLRQQEMLSQIKDIRVTETATTIEAALLENDLIKKFQPPYNKALLKRNLQPVWLNYDLELADKDVAWRGPLIDERSVREFHAVRLLLEQGNADQLFEIQDVDELWRQTAVILRDHLAARGLLQYHPRRLAAVALRMWREQVRVVEEDLPEEDDNENEKDETQGKVFVWTPELCAVRCLSILVNFARQLRRASAISRLVNADVYFKLPSQGWRVLHMRSANVLKSSAVERRPRHLLQRRVFIDRSTLLDDCQFDRLRILVGELERYPLAHQIFVQKD